MIIVLQFLMNTIKVVGGLDLSKVLKDSTIIIGNNFIRCEERCEFTEEFMTRLELFLRGDKKQHVSIFLKYTGIRDINIHKLNQIIFKSDK